MCRRVECSKCGRPTYAGCGMHVEQVLSNVPAARRCRCCEERAKKPSPEGAGARSWLRRLFGE